MRLSSKEEIVVELFRSLGVEQRNEMVRRMRAAADANRLIQKKLRKPINPVSNERVTARFGKAPPRLGRRHKHSELAPEPRRPDRNQDDSTPET